MAPSNILRLPRTVQTSLRNHIKPQSSIRPLSTPPPRPAEKDQDPERHPNPQRDAQEDRTQFNPDSNEYSKSGTDDTAAGNDEAAFDPNITDPQAAK